MVIRVRVYFGRNLVLGTGSTSSFAWVVAAEGVGSRIVDVCAKSDWR